MKKILLHGAALRNDDSFVDAGETVAVGDTGDAIAAKRAQALVDSAQASPAPVEQTGKPEQRG